jgi:hypothetical protein
VDGPAGSNGADGTLGKGAGAVGIFSGAGFAAANGEAGGDGHVGQGGSGGGASAGSGKCVGATGGAGGMGGCGGTKGEGGKGGGASVALLVWDSGVALDAVELHSAKGGDGGNGGGAGGGGTGGDGAPGGEPDVTNGIGRGGRGGPALAARVALRTRSSITVPSRPRSTLGHRLSQLAQVARKEKAARSGRVSSIPPQMVPMARRAPGCRRLESSVMRTSPVLWRKLQAGPL